MNNVTVETGHFGRLFVVRVKPNEDLIESVEAVCREHGLARAVIRSALGSLIDGNLHLPNDTIEHVDGPGVEILSVNGEVTAGNTILTGVIAGTDGAVHAGRFQRGGNLAFITMEISLQEWIPAPAEAAH